MMQEVEGQVSLFDQDLQFGKMSPEPSVPTKDKTSKLSLNPSPKLPKKMPLYLCLRKTNGQQADASWEMGGALLGEFSMHSFGESPKEDVESHLSQILEVDAPKKYYLSATACLGILRRARRRKKELPFLLHEALIHMIFKEDENGQKGIADTIEILRKMWCEIGEENLKEWIQRTFVLVQSEEVLLGEMCEPIEDTEDTNEQVLVEGDSTKNYAKEGLCNMRSEGEIGDTPQRREPNEQLSQELDLLMQKLSFEDTQTEVIMYCLRIACEGETSVFETLPTVSEGEILGVYDNTRESTVTYSINHQGGNVEQIIEDKAGTLTASMNSSGNNKLSVAYGFPLGFRPENVRCYDIGDRRTVANESVDVSPTLLSKMGTGGNNVPVVVEGLDVYNQCLTGDKSSLLRAKNADSDHIPCVDMDRSAYNQGENAKFNIGIDEDGVAFSHIAKGPGAVRYVVDQGGGKSGANVTENLSPTLTCTHGGEPVICLQGNQIDQADTSVCNGSGFKEGTSYTLNVRDRHAVAYGVTTKGNGDAFISEERHTSLSVGGGQAGQGYPCVLYQKPHYIVRRLTPLECERLQGYPDGWTDIGEYIDSKGKKKQTSDTVRYKALGNSIALPPWKWIIKRLCSHYERDATMASLFDGIGGFPCLWEQINGKGAAIWASEIEDFPIAVTQLRIE